MSETVLRARSIRKVYGGIVALDDVNFELKAGEIHALCGENGAGKSTLVKILGGLVRPDEGSVEVAGEVLRPGRRTDPRLISIVHQELSIIPALSVLDNVLLGSSKVGALYWRRGHAAEVRRQIDALGLSHVDLHQPAGELSLAELQLIEIARGVARGARVLVLDEPTATLSDSEIRRVFDAVRWLREQGTTIVFISHRLAEVFELTDRITVFRSGRHIETTETAEMTPKGLVRAMIGRDVERRQAPDQDTMQQRPVRLSLRGLGIGRLVQPMDLDVAAGEILGVVGQLGSGADQLVEALAGLRPSHGRILLDGRAVTVDSSRAAIAAGIAYVPEDRAGKGVFLEAPVLTNMSASVLASLTRHGFIRRRRERDLAMDLARQFALDPRRLPSQVSHLSGGNQQKVAMAKAAAMGPRLLVLNEPTRGVDIGARAEIYRRLQELANEGLSIVFFSTDFEEVLELADRVVTVFRGRRVNDLPVARVTMNSILSDIIHGPDTQEDAA